MFSDCVSLEDFTITDNVKQIDVAAFQNCSSLKSLTIGSGLSTIGNMAFSGCECLTSLTINCAEVKSWFRDFGSLTELIMGDNVSTIEDRAFFGCSRLSDITIGTGITSIGERAFANSDKLKSVTIKAEIAPTTSKSAFEGSYPDYATLFTPALSLEAYKSEAPWNSFKEILAYNSVIYDQKCEKPTIVLANGQFFLKSETEGAEIHYEVFSSVKGDGYSIKLPDTYTISAYASKDGYQDSDVETIKITLAIGDVNNDGSVNAADIVTIVNIIMGK